MGFVQINVERITGSGDAKDVICSVVEKLRADTLVLGSHGYGFIKRYKVHIKLWYCLSDDHFLLTQKS